MKKRAIYLNAAEMQSGLDRVRYAENLILQLPCDHDGRNTWLMNYGVGVEAEALRINRGLSFDKVTSSAELAK